MLRNSAGKFIGCSSGILSILLATGGVFLFWALCVAQGEYVYDALAKRDPFIPLVSPQGVLLKLDEEEAAGKLKIEGIIYDKNGTSYAIVDGKVARVGDFTDKGYQVLKIESNKVVFIKEGEPLEIYLREEINAK